MRDRKRYKIVILSDQPFMGVLIDKTCKSNAMLKNCRVLLARFDDVTRGPLDFSHDELTQVESSWVDPSTFCTPAQKHLVKCLTKWLRVSPLNFSQDELTQVESSPHFAPQPKSNSSDFSNAKTFFLTRYDFFIYVIVKLNCVLIHIYLRGLMIEKFRAQVDRKVRTLKALEETIRYVYSLNIVCIYHFRPCTSFLLLCNPRVFGLCMNIEVAGRPFMISVL